MLSSYIISEPLSIGTFDKFKVKITFLVNRLVAPINLGAYFPINLFKKGVTRILSEPGLKCGMNNCPIRLKKCYPRP
jgi:hypothetical protein